MLRIFADAETYYDKSYSLRHLSPVEYILNPQFEVLGWAVAIDHEAPFLLPRSEIVEFLKGIKQPYAFITHNALFDACIMAYHYDIHPDGLLCTLSMSRALIWHEIPNGRLSLKNVLKHLHLPEKQDFIAKMEGKHWRDLEADPGLLMLFSGYATNDVAGCREIFFALRKQFPASEAMVMDRVIRMATQPVLHVDVVQLGDYRESVREHKRYLLSRVTHNDPAKLASNPQFAELLRSYGVLPPMKTSPATGEQTYAFAKTDHAFTALLEHEDPEVQMLVAARLGIKTTIEETRSSRMMRIGVCTNTYLGSPKLPMPLKYSGAHTHRYSGDWQLNMQNLSARKSKAIRKCIHAPPGFTIVAVDAAQIEARLTAWLAGEHDLLKQFASGEDTYRNFAAEIFRVKDVREVTKAQRFVGKTCILGLGFGMSAAGTTQGGLYRTIVNLAREQSIDIEITLGECEQWVRTYRTKFMSINRYWNKLLNIIALMANGHADDLMIGPCKIKGTTITMPSGLQLFYDNLRLETDDNGKENYWYNSAQYTKKIYGQKLLENVVQALDRQHVVDAGIRAELRARELGVQDPRVLLNVHDENIHCVPDRYVDTMAQVALGEMRWNEPWAAGLPLAAEVKVGKNFGEMEEWKP
jgi:DNA polymerase family A